MVSPPWKLLLEAYSHQFLTQNSKEGLWQPRGIPGEGNRREKWEMWRVIYRERSPPTLWQSSGHLATLAYVQWFLHNVQKVSRKSKHYPKSIQKSRIHLVVPRTFVVLFVERTFDGPPRTFASWGLMFGFYFLKVQSMIRLTLKVLGLAKTSLLKTFVDYSYGKYFI